MLNKLEEILTQNNVFLSGGAGVGKSFLTNELIKSYKKQGKMVVSLGSSALSAFNISGVTLHSFFCFGHCDNHLSLSIYDKSQKQREKLAKLRESLKKTKLIIIDEISMVSADIFEMIGLRLRNSSFDGKILVVGDFFQLPPVIKESKDGLFRACNYAFASFFWQDLNFTNIKLSLPKRTQDTQFYENLSLIRQGFLNDELLKFFEKLCINKKEFEKISDDYTLLCGINKRVDFINKNKLDKINAPLKKFNAEIYKEDKNLNDEALQGWIKSLNISLELELKVGARVIFCVNNWEKNYYNGEQGVVSEIIYDDDKVYIEIIKNNGFTTLLEPYAFRMEEFENSENKILATCLQFPIKLAYAITIHKSQGMSIEKLVCDIDNIFEKGQLYVALSRATNFQTLKIYFSKALDFCSYFASILKVDFSVLNFYKEQKFLDLEM